jgi:hypothetical protein
MISVARDSDSVAHAPGTGGDLTRIKLSDKTAVITLTLAALSASNDYLSALVAADELPGANVVGPSLLRDLNGRSLVQGAASWVQRVPNLDYGSDEAMPREWLVVLHDAKIVVGGMTEIGL